MQLSKETLEILKNYSGLNQNIILSPEKKLMTLTQAKNVFSKSSIEEEFPQEFGIYDINEFISVLSLFEKPEIEFNEKYMTISQGKNQIKYLGASKEIMAVPTDLQFEKLEGFMAAKFWDFEISEDLLSSLLKTASAIKAPDMSFVGEDGKFKIVMSDLKNKSSNKYEYDFSDNCNETFNVDLKVENLKMRIVDYKVEISRDKALSFKHVDSDLIYYIAFEETSKV